MKKNLEHLVGKLETTQKQTLSGGFATIKGGAALRPPSNNSGNCTNGNCSGTNSSVCTNTGDCHLSTNNQPGGCTNQSTCFS